MTLDIPGLRRLWLLALLAGAASFAGALAWAYLETEFGWVWWVAAFGLAVIVYSAAFYTLCSCWAPGLAAFILAEETEVEGADVVTRTTVAPSEDETLNFYLWAYVRARGTSMVAASTLLMIALALAVFVLTP